MSKKQYPSVEYLRQVLEYRDGKLFWLERPREHFKSDASWKYSKTRFSGTEAGHLGHSKRGNVTVDRHLVNIDGSHIYRSLIVWALHHGQWPKHLIDHKDQNTLNDKIENLRECTKSLNGANQKIKSNNKSGFKGVFRLESGRFLASIMVNRKTYYLGRYDTAEEAADVYAEAAKEHFGEFAYTGRLDP